LAFLNILIINLKCPIVGGFIRDIIHNIGVAAVLGEPFGDEPFGDEPFPFPCDIYNIYVFIL
jgi:hypothetical protein